MTELDQTASDRIPPPASEAVHICEWGAALAVAELARRLGAPVVRLAGAEEHDFVEGDVLVVAVTTSGSATGLPDPPDGAAIVAVPISVGSVVEG